MGNHVVAKLHIESIKVVCRYNELTKVRFNKLIVI